MGATHQSVSGNAVREQDYDEVRLAAENDEQYRGLQHAFRVAVEAAIKNDAAVKAAVASEVQRQIIDKFKTAKANRAPWPFKVPS
jgi:hypothetical protein